MKYFFKFILFFCILSNVIGWESFSDRLVISKNGLNMREKPSVKGKIIFTIPYQGKVKVLESLTGIVMIGKTHGSWSKVVYKSRTGWVFGAYLKYIMPVSVKKSKDLEGTSIIWYRSRAATIMSKETSPEFETGMVIVTFCPKNVLKASCNLMGYGTAITKGSWRLSEGNGKYFNVAIKGEMHSEIHQETSEIEDLKVNGLIEIQNGLGSISILRCERFQNWQVYVTKRPIEETLCK